MELKKIYCVKWCMGYLGFGVNEYGYKYFDDYDEAVSFANDLKNTHHIEVRVCRVG